jgi:DNA mismatch repair protein MSH4
MVVMSQTGSLLVFISLFKKISPLTDTYSIPATYASFPITHQLFARISLDDSLEANVSTFASEMRETAFILKNITPSSLVIMDELGRGSSTRDGMALALAVCEALVQTRAFVWFATHFREIPQILAGKSGVVSLRMEVQVNEQNTMKMLYKVAEGSVQALHYGLALAHSVGLPATLLDRAKEVAELLDKRREEKRKASRAHVVARRRALVLRLLETLAQARDGRMQGGVLKNWLQSVQADFVERMEGLREEEEGEAGEGGGEEEETEVMEDRLE